MVDLDRLDPTTLGRALAATDVGVWTWDLTTNAVRWSETMEKLFGMRHGEFTGTHDAYETLLHPEDRDDMLAALREALTNKQRFRKVHRIVRPSGEIRWLDGGGEPITDDTGNAIGMIGAAIDITDRQEAVRSYDKFLAALLERSYDAVCVTDHQGVFTYVSPSVRQVLGYTSEELIGTNGLRLIHPDDLSETESALERTVETPGNHNEIVVRVVRADGAERWLAIQATNLREEEHIGGLVINFRDVTERRQGRRQLEMRLQQQEALAELGQAALAAANPLSVMNAAVECVSKVLKVELCGALELQEDKTSMLLRACAGCEPGRAGSATVGVGSDSQSGYTLRSQGPVIVDDFRTETRFSVAPPMLEYDVVSGLSVIIAGDHGPYGVLGAHTKQHRVFTDDDVNFLQSVANLIALSIQRRERDETIRTLSTPVMLIAPRALLVPIVGRMDEARAEQLEDVLLNAIRDRRASSVILDVTGAVVFERTEMDLLSRAIAAAQILGAKVILSGADPSFAAMAVRSRMNVDTVIVVRDLQSGIQLVLNDRHPGSPDEPKPGNGSSLRSMMRTG